jgi:hypothetical protein
LTRKAVPPTSSATPSSLEECRADDLRRRERVDDQHHTGGFIVGLTSVGSGTFFGLLAPFLLTNRGRVIAVLIGLEHLVGDVLEPRPVVALEPLGERDADEGSRSRAASTPSGARGRGRACGVGPRRTS